MKNTWSFVRINLSENWRTTTFTKSLSGIVIFDIFFNFNAFSKPDLLQNLAWFVLVGYMKRIQHPKGAFEAARRFLPYNSKIRCPFAEPEPDEKKGPREKYIKME
jgi:hypothetical protein